MQFALGVKIKSVEFPPAFFKFCYFKLLYSSSLLIVLYRGMRTVYLKTSISQQLICAVFIAIT